MALAFFALAILLIVVAYQGTQDELKSLLVADFTGPNNFIIWIAAVLLIGLLGYIPRLKPVSNAFLVLLFVVIFLVNGKGFFDRFNAALKGTATAPAPAIPSTTSGGNPGGLAPQAPTGSFVPGVDPLPPGWPQGVDPFSLPGVPQ